MTEMALAVSLNDHERSILIIWTSQKERPFGILVVSIFLSMIPYTLHGSIELLEINGFHFLFHGSCKSHIAGSRPRTFQGSC